MAAAQAFPVGQRPGEGEGGINRHGAGHEGLRALRVGRVDGDAIGVVGVSAEGVVRAVDEGLTAAVLGQHPVELFGIHVGVILS